MVAKTVAKTVQICERGECGGECYKCRCRRLVAEVEELRENLGSLCDAVGAMRHAQREYFRTRSGHAMDRAKRLEKRVDALVAELDGARPRNENCSARPEES